MATMLQPPMFVIEYGDRGAAEKLRRWRKRWHTWSVSFLLLWQAPTLLLSTFRGKITLLACIRPCLWYTLPLVVEHFLFAPLPNGYRIENDEPRVLPETCPSTLQVGVQQAANQKKLKMSSNEWDGRPSTSSKERKFETTRKTTEAVARKCVSSKARNARHGSIKWKRLKMM